MTAFFAEFSNKGNEMRKILTKGGCQRAARGGKINVSYSNRRRPLHFLGPLPEKQRRNQVPLRLAVRQCGDLP